MDSELVVRVAALESQNRRFRRLLGAQLLVLTGGLAGVGWNCAGASSATLPVLRVSELIVVDPQGVERVRVGGDLPDAVIAGKRVPRGEKVAGVMLYDDTGQERGGYVTFSPSGNVALTLDTRKGQVALFAADPEEGAALRLWTEGNEVALWVDGDGARVNAVRDKKVVYQQPLAGSPGTSTTCTELRGFVKEHGADVIFGACNERRTADWCRECLGS